MSFPKVDGYVVTERLGSGSYSTVYKAYTKVGARSVVAIKCVDKARVKHSGAAVDNLITEIRLLKTLSHPHIVHMKEFTWDDRNIYIIMEYCSGGDLSKYIHRYGRVPEKQVLYFLQQLASALQYLRQREVVHMDLKPHNLLLDRRDTNTRYTLKVADFGFARLVSPADGRCVRGSPLYMAPEMFEGRDCDARVDLWSVGVIMYECLFGRAPYSSATFKELVHKIESRAPIQIPRTAHISSGCRSLLTSLLQHDPDHRISYEQFFAHDYLDLEYMPSKENYDKAVSLIKRAVELDSGLRSVRSGRVGSDGSSDGAPDLELARTAFQLYRDSLRRLVPCARAEPDPVRRAALGDKLTRYMERAEELKQYIKYVETGVVPASSTPASADTNTRNTSDQHAVQCVHCKRSSKQCHCSNKKQEQVTAVEEVVSEPAKPRPVARSHSDRERSPGRFGLRRLFGRQNTLPYLDTKDSSIADDSGQSDQPKGAVGENDTCRIT